MEQPTAENLSPFVNASPVDGSDLEEVIATPKGEVPGLVSRARVAQAAWAATPVRERAKLLLSVKSRILDRAAALAKVIHLEIGKPEVEALFSEVLPTAKAVDFWTESIEELLEVTDLELDRIRHPGKSGVICHEARGVVALITPWNYPFAIPLRTLIPAILAGNAVVFKPSETAPRVGGIVGELFLGILPPGVLEIAQGGEDVGAALAAADVDLVVFSGRIETGRQVAHACAERLSPCALELGGKDAAIVLADANVARAAAGVVWGALTNAGRAGAIERVYVESKIAGRFIEAVVAEVKTLRAKVEVGPLATAAQKDKALAQLAAAKAAGATVLVEGGANGEGGAIGGVWMVPVVVSVESDDSPLIRDETFGPVIPIAVVADAEEAIRRANASRFGLAASIWTRHTPKAQAMAHRLRVGVVTINNHARTATVSGAPTGQGETGYGVTSSPLALQGLTRPRLVLADRSGGKEIEWYPYTPAMMRMALALAVLRSGTTGIFQKLAAFVRFLGARLARFSP
jgi:acyl-CoA reductase-like NAD-dependent aldehyde dehydrogenase